MPQRDFHFRPPPGVPQAENVTQEDVVDTTEPVDLLKQLGLDDDDPFGDRVDIILERAEPRPRMRMTAAAAAAAATSVQHGGSAKDNPFLDRVSIKKWDINPHRINHDLKHQ